LPEFQRSFIKYSLVIVNGTKDPVALGSVKYFGEKGHDTLQVVYRGPTISAQIIRALSRKLSDFPREHEYVGNASIDI
jgi:hypothetical protein